ncbi:Uncharacterised protein [Bordetella pertussis]|nr:Uncharacterised protein [Bordetella pertussis]CPJ46030.1 Uncharacterised protein [Bordetella pertussis]CPO12224.1 Uncharacterised protein [Bordetella pertussis]
MAWANSATAGRLGGREAWSSSCAIRAVPAAQACARGEQRAAAISFSTSAAGLARASKIVCASAATAASTSGVRVFSCASFSP